MATQVEVDIDVLLKELEESWTILADAQEEATYLQDSVRSLSPKIGAELTSDMLLQFWHMKEKVRQAIEKLLFLRKAVIDKKNA